MIGAGKVVRAGERLLHLPALEDLILRHAAGEEVAGIAMPTPAAGVMMIPIPREGIYVSVEGLNDARAAPDTPRIPGSLQSKRYTRVPRN